MSNILIELGKIDHAGKDESKKQTNEKTKQHRCDTCDAIFSYKHTLKKHIEINHEETKIHNCEICASTFAHKEYLQSHIISVHKRSRSKKCSLCGHVSSESGYYYCL